MSQIKVNAINDCPFLAHNFYQGGYCDYSHRTSEALAMLLASKGVCLLTPWSRVPLEKLTGFQLVKKFPAFCGTRRFITAFTSARHLSPSWDSLMQSIPPHPTSWRSILILSLAREYESCIWWRGAAWWQFYIMFLYVYLSTQRFAYPAERTYWLAFITNSTLAGNHTFISKLCMLYSTISTSYWTIFDLCKDLLNVNK
jgi:hypothetical protein